MRRYRVLFIFLAVALTAGLGYAVFSPTLGVRQNLAEEEFQRAWLLYQDRKYDAAIEKFSEALLINPRFNWARRFLAQAYFYSGQTSEALEEYDILYRAQPHDLTLKTHIAAMSSQSGDGLRENPEEFLRIVPRTQGYRYNRPTFIGNLRSDQIALLSLGNFEIGNMISYSAQGEAVNNQHRVSGKLSFPMAFAQNNDEVWITDFKDDRIHRLNKNPKFYLAHFFNPDAVGKSGEGDLEFRAPAGICHRAGEFIVADSGNNRLTRISEDGKFISHIVRPAGGDSLQTPFGIYCDAENIWITESGAGRVTHFDRYGNIVKEFSPSILKKPRHITYDSEQKLFLVADESAGIVSMNDLGEIVRQTKGYANTTGKFVTFARPYAAQFDAFRNLYVADYGASEVVQFVPKSDRFSELYLQVEKITAAKFPNIGVYVTVKGAGNKYLTELSGSDFKIFENDASVGNLGATYLSQFDDVLQTVFVVPRTKRMAEYEPQFNWVLDQLLTRIREKDRLKVFSHGGDVRVEADFGNSRLNILRAVRAAIADGQTLDSVQKTQSTALYDATQDLLTREGKRVVVYFTDGAMDEDSLDPYDKTRLINFARANHIAVYVISFEHPEVTTPDSLAVLKELAQKTGGEYHRALEISPEIDAHMRGRKEERYLLNYQSQARKQMRGQYIDLRVLAKFRQGRGLELSGYFIP